MNPGKVAQPNREPGSEALPTQDFGSAGSSLLPQGSACLRDLGLSWEILGRERVGFGAVAWLSLMPSAPNLTTCSSVSADARAFRIGETGQVPEIEVENLGRSPLLLPAHLILAGGWQTRAVERSVIVPAGASARAPVKCVESGRWAPRDEESARSFQIIERSSARTRWWMSMSMSNQLARHGRFTTEQSAVWQHIEEELSRSPEVSQTRSYEAYLQGVKKQHVEAAKSARVRAPARANGLVLFPRGGGFWMEAYASPEALADELDDQLADLFDIGSTGDADINELPSIEPLLSLLWSLPLRELERLPGTLGSSYALDLGGSSPMVPETSGSLVMIDKSLVHMAVGCAPLRGPVRKATPQADAEAQKEDAPPRGPGPRLVQVPPRAEAPGSHERPKIGREAMRSIYERARALLPFDPPPPNEIAGYRLMRIVEGNVSWVDIRMSGDGYAVLGSHDRCDLILANDTGIWLRHLVAICVRLESGNLGLRLIDLKTDVPFFLEDDVPQWSVITSGPFAMRLGRHVICGFPIGVDADADDEREGSAGAAPRRPGTGMSSINMPASASSNDSSTATVSSVHMALNDPRTLFPAAPVSQIQELVSEPQLSRDHVRVTLERGGMGASVELPSGALDTGVLLGRALNCFDGGLRRIFCDAISRAHVLLLRDRDDIFALDLATTNGTRVSGRRIRRYRLSDRGTTLELGKKVLFRWYRPQALVLPEEPGTSGPR